MLKRPPLSLGFFYEIYKIVLSNSGHDCRSPHVALYILLYLKVTLKWLITDGSNHINILNFRVKVRTTGCSDQKLAALEWGVAVVLVRRCDTIQEAAWFELYIYPWVWRFIRQQNAPQLLKYYGTGFSQLSSSALTISRKYHSSCSNNQECDLAMTLHCVVPKDDPALMS